MYHLLDHCNAHNARELARCAAIGPECAVPLRTRGWAPPTECIEVPWLENGRHVSGGERGNRWRNLGRGHKISCGNAVRADMEFFASVIARVWAKISNVVRAFDEAHLTEGWRWEWIPDPEAMKDAPSDFGWVRSAVCNGGGNDPIHRLTRGNKDRATPPNHGHGAKCGCGVNRLLPENATIRMDNPKFESVADAYGQSFVRAATGPRCMVVIPRCAPFLLQPDANGKFVTRDADGRVFAANWPDDDCPHCAGTGRIICDDERAGRVSPSHAAGGYAEWQRGTMEFSVTDHDGTRPLGRITNMRSVDGFVVGDIELEDGSVVVERLMRSPFSSSEIGDAEPATTERE